MKVLVTGGAGYIGSHTIVELLAAGHECVCIDNFVNSSPESIKRVEQISDSKVPLVEADIRDTHTLIATLKEHSIEAVVHFAALKAVGESVEKPLEYYRNNLESLLSLLEAMDSTGVSKLIFSSSATVYGAPDDVPIMETADATRATNPYGSTKVESEKILSDVARADPELAVYCLRYFNPIGAHESGLIGEDPHGLPNNLFPYISKVAVGELESVKVFGDDYDTPDGTGVRDYVHVVDLARGHVKALEKLQPGVEFLNLGTGKGVSVLEAIRAFEHASGKNISYEVTARRPGDIATCYADVSLAEKKLGWQATYSLEEACRDAWNWQSNNPDGYSSSDDTIVAQ